MKIADSYRYLGVHLNDRMDWRMSRLYFLRKLSFFLQFVQQDFGTSLWQQAPLTSLLSAWRGQRHFQRRQQGRQTSPQGWKHHWSEYRGIRVSEGQEATEQAITPTPLHSRAHSPTDFFISAARKTASGNHSYLSL